MPFYNQAHQFYAGVDLHARSMFIHVLNAKGKTVFENDLPAGPDEFLDAVKPFRKNLVVGCECMFAWYWLADLCEDQRIPFVLGHALAMKHIHGGKAKSDRIDAGKLAAMLRGGLFPLAYVYPKAKRQTRDLLRRRSFFVRQRAQLITHIQNTNSQFNLPPFPKKLTYARNRSADIAARFADPSTRLSIQANLNLIDAYDEQIATIERHLLHSAKVDDPVTFGFLRTVPGIGPILGLILLYEIDRIDRFPEAGNFLSYSRLVRCAHESAGKVKGFGGKKIGNAHLKWAFSEAACLMLRSSAPVKAWLQRQEAKRGKRKALSVLEAKIGRTVYHLWRKQRAFDVQRFLKNGEPQAEEPRRK
ncbi:MAG TPA: IS110 family transposase [Gemmataceae bacterium]|nr:IS110 family transposase [Gemmataceae bacterium]